MKIQEKILLLKRTENGELTEIHTLHEKLDQLIIQQQQELIEVQKEQNEKLDQILEKLKNS